MVATATLTTTEETDSAEDRIAALEARIAELEANMPDDRVTIVVFSGDLDRVLASLIIATGAMAMGQEVSMFFTFWGLSTLKKRRILAGKSLKEKMMAIMSPSSTKGMGVSKMNYFGVGSIMLRQMMKDKNVESFESLLDLVVEMGARVVSCGMTQDVMGITQEELRDDVEDGGVAAYLGDALRSKVTLFI